MFKIRFILQNLHNLYFIMFRIYLLIGFILNQVFICFTSQNYFFTIKRKFVKVIMIQKFFHNVS